MRTRPFRRIEIDKDICLKVAALKDAIHYRGSFTSFIEELLIKSCASNPSAVSPSMEKPPSENASELLNDTGIDEEKIESREAKTWLNAKEAALYIGRKSPTSYRTMLFMARYGKIRSGNNGKTFVFKPEDLDSWMYLNAKKIAR